MGRSSQQIVRGDGGPLGYIGGGVRADEAGGGLTHQQVGLAVAVEISRARDIPVGRVELAEAFERIRVAVGEHHHGAGFAVEQHDVVPAVAREIADRAEFPAGPVQVAEARERAVEVFWVSAPIGKHLIFLFNIPWPQYQLADGES